MEAAKIDLKEIQTYLAENLGFSQEDNEKIIEFRHWMHQNAEGHLKEFKT
jgi:CRISPR/Cas system type I-B associated protein Csh2 (Cas7 group RAMP superfamily)